MIRRTQPVPASHEYFQWDFSIFASYPATIEHKKQ